MQERPIWRPNSASTESWERLSREEQIAWWRSHEPAATPSPPGPSLVLDGYLRGMLNEMEFISRTFDGITAKNVNELDRFPREQLDAIDEYLEQMPADEDDAGWAETIRVFGGMHAPWVTREDIARERESSRLRTRNAVRICRAYRRETQ